MLTWFKSLSIRGLLLLAAILIAINVALALIAPAHAQDEVVLVPVTLSWTHPTTRVDGTPFPPEMILETRIWCDGGGWPPTKFVPPTENTVVLELAPGVHSCFAKTASTEKDSAGKIIVSDASTALEFTVEAPKPPDPVKPNAPAEMKATQVLQAGSP